ncbi:MAG TPA: response regulator, partial [Blastocatellia bacterium]|nr:response regulator [Blastocatellia bacterium]
MSSQATGRVISGIGPIDKVLGGLEQGRCHLLVGRPGSGKTTFGAQFLITSLNKNERVIMVTRLSAQEVVDRFAKLGYDYFAYGESNDRLIIFEQGDEIVEHIRNLEDFSAVATELEETIKEHKPARVVFDPTSYLIEAETPAARAARAKALVELLNRVQTTSLLIIDEVENDAVAAPLTELCSNVFYLNAKPGEKGSSILGFAKVGNPAGSGHEMPVLVSGTTGITAAQVTSPLKPMPATQRLETPPPVSFDVPTAYAPPPFVPPAEPATVQPAAQQSAPAAQTAPLKPQPSTAFNAEPAHAEKFHVLVIDDDPATCNLISRALRQDCEVTAVNDGASGLKKLASGNTYDLIILDVNLPVVDGFHICQHIRKTQWQVPIIIVTGTHLRAEDRLHSASAGGDLYLTKPFSVHELRLRVRQMIGRYRNVSEWVGAGAGMGLESAISESVSPEPEEQFVAYDVFVQRLSRHTERARAVGLPFSIVGCTLATNGNGSNKASRMVDAVRYQIRERDVMTVTPERQDR